MDVKVREKRNNQLPAVLLLIMRGPAINACTLLLLFSCWFVASSMMATMAATGVSLDLSSTKATMTGSGAIGKLSSVSILVGGRTETVSGSTALTPAEYMAAVQVATSGKQLLNIGTNGNAIGGLFTTNALNQAISALTIPSNVTAIDNFAASSKLDLTGNLINSGTFYAISTAHNVTSATISANNIINQQGGLLTSVLPTGGLSGYSGLITDLSLTLNAATSLINHGIISSAGALQLSAGTSIANTTIGGTAATIQAATSLSLSAPTITNAGQITALLNDINVTANSLTNSSIMQAAQGALSVQNLTGNTLTILNTGGTLAALHDLTFTGGSASNPGSLNISGGILSGAALSLNAPKGNISVSVLDAPNSVDISAGNFQLAISNGTHGLTIGHIANLDSGALSYNGIGDVSFHGFTTNGGNVDINTTGDISVLGPGNSAGPGTLDTTQTSGNAGYVSLKSGEAITVGDITTTGAGTGNGGNITLQAATTVAAGNLNASGGASGGNPGVITVGAGGTGNGAITTGSITDSGAAGSRGGTVSLTSGGTIDISGNLTAPGATVTMSSTGNNISGTVNVTGGNVDLEDSNGEPYVVNFSQLARFGGSNLQVGSNSFTSDIVLSSDCKDCLGSVGSLTFDTQGHFLATGHTLTLDSGTDLNVIANAGINTGSISGGHSASFSTQGALTVDGSINITGAVSLSADNNGQGNALSITTGNNVSGTTVALTSGKGNIIDAGNLTANAGDLTLATGGNISVGTGTSLSSNLGNVLLAAAGNIVVNQGAQFASTASVTGKASGNTPPSYTGGQIGISAGMSQTQISSIMSSLVSSRVAGKEVLSVTGGAFDSSNTVNSKGSSVLEVVFPADASKSISNSVFNLNGGVVYIDPPSNGNTVEINGATFNVSGPQLQGGATGGGTTGGGNSGGGPTGGGITGAGGGTTGGGLLGGGNSGSSTSTFGSALFPNDTNGNSSTQLTLTFGTGISTITSKDNLGTTLENSSAIVPSDSTPADGPKGSVFKEAIYCAQPGLLTENQKIDKDSWIIAANKCQPFSFEGSDGSIIIGSGPAIFAPARNHTLLLKEGKLLIIAGQIPIIVRTPLCNVTVPLNSASTVEYSPDGIARLTSLAGGKASVSITRDGETMILSASAGEQLVLTESALNDSQIVCQPPVTNKKVNNWMISMGGVHGQKFTFERGEMVAREGLLNCTLGCFTKIQQAMIDQIRKSMLLNQPNELKSLVPVKHSILISRATHMAPAGFSQKNADHLSAVGFGDILDLTIPQVTTLTAASATVKYTTAAGVGIGRPNAIDLNGGDVVITTTAPTTVKAGKYAVRLGADTVAMISNRGDHVIVRNLYEPKAGSATVFTPDRKSVGAQVGQELIIGRAGLSYTRVLGEDAVGRRRMRHLDMGNLSNVITSEVSLISLLENTEILSQLTHSDAAADQAIVRKVEKMAVVLSLVTQNHGNYSIIGK